MAEHASDLFGYANSGTDKVVGKNDVDVGISKALRKIFRHLWPIKTTAYLSIAADITARSAERILGGEQGVSLDVYCRLLRSEHGAAILEATMTGAMPRWWKETYHERRIAAARRRRLDAERELRELEDQTN